MNTSARCFLLLGIVVVSGCAGKTAKVDTATLKPPPIQPQAGQPAYKAKGAVGFQVVGDANFTGHADANPMRRAALGTVSVDLKAMQEKIGSLILRSIYDDVEISRADPVIRSGITDFSYRFPYWTLRVDMRPNVSFRLRLQAVKGGKVALERVIDVKNFEAKKGAIPWAIMFAEVGGIFFLQKDYDRYSKVVSEAAAQATYEAYLKELPEIAKALAQ